MEKTIAIFDDNFIAVGFIDLVNDTLIGIADDKTILKKIRAALLFLEQHGPRRRKEFRDDAHNLVVDSEEAKRSDPDYLFVVAETLKGNGVRSVVVPSAIKETVVRLGKAAISGEERKNILGDLIYAPEEEIKTIAAFTVKLKELEGRL
jgi:hypothetical protein